MADQNGENDSGAKELPRPIVEEHDRFGFRKSFERHDHFKNWDYRTEGPKPK